MPVDTGSLLYQMQQSGTLTDIMFVVQGTEIRAHRNVVTCRGGKLAKMFEDNQQSVEIDDITVDTFLTVLEYV